MISAKKIWFSGTDYWHSVGNGCTPVNLRSRFRKCRVVPQNVWNFCHIFWEADQSIYDSFRGTQWMLHMAQVLVPETYRLRLHLVLPIWQHSTAKRNRTGITGQKVRYNHDSQNNDFLVTNLSNETDNNEFVLTLVPWDPAQNLGDLQSVQDVQNGGSTSFICMMVRCVHPGQITAFSDQKRRIKWLMQMCWAVQTTQTSFTYRICFISYETQVWLVFGFSCSF